MVKSREYKTWIEISKNSLANNIKTFRSILTSKTKLFAVVKSNAYGHGLMVFSKLADELGVQGFCVDSVAEGHTLRDIGIQKPILVLGPTLPSRLSEAAADDVILTVSNFEALAALIESKVKTDFHLKVDTGLHRQGFYFDDLNKVLKILKQWPQAHGQFKGVYTHFAAAKDITYPYYTLGQIEVFKKTKELFLKAGFKNLMFHAAATGGTILYPQSHFDLVRVGMGLYGYWPTGEALAQHSLIWRRNLGLKPVLSWRALISEIKNLKAGDFVGYDLTCKICRDTKSAIIPVGYWHGFPRSLSNKGRILVRGDYAKVLGRVAMDLLTVELPEGIKTKVGETATLIGREKEKTITAHDLAILAETSVYETLTRLNPLIKRDVFNS